MRIRSGYHYLRCFDKTFCVEKRWKLIREMGAGAYGVVMLVARSPLGCPIHLLFSRSSAADEISGETVAIKMVTRVFDKLQLAKRALRELVLLRHFNNHENITGIIDADAISSKFNDL